MCIVNQSFFLHFVLKIFLLDEAIRYEIPHDINSKPLVCKLNWWGNLCISSKITGCWRFMDYAWLMWFHVIKQLKRSNYNKSGSAMDNVPTKLFTISVFIIIWRGLFLDRRLYLALSNVCKNPITDPLVVLGNPFPASVTAMSVIQKFEQVSVP